FELDRADVRAVALAAADHARAAGELERRVLRLEQDREPVPDEDRPVGGERHPARGDVDRAPPEELARVDQLDRRPDQRPVGQDAETAALLVARRLHQTSAFSTASSTRPGWNGLTT